MKRSELLKRMVEVVAAAAVVPRLPAAAAPAAPALPGPICIHCGAPVIMETGSRLDPTEQRKFLGQRKSYVAVLCPECGWQNVKTFRP